MSLLPGRPHPLLLKWVPRDTRRDIARIQRAGSVMTTVQIEIYPHDPPGAILSCVWGTVRVTEWLARPTPATLDVWQELARLASLLIGYTPEQEQHLLAHVPVLGMSCQLTLRLQGYYMTARGGTPPRYLAQHLF